MNSTPVRHEVKRVAVAGCLALVVGASMLVVPVSTAQAGTTVTAASSTYGAKLTTWVASRPGLTSAATYDLVSGRKWASHGTRPGYSASIVKVATVAALLQKHGYPLTTSQQRLARSAITRSDNAAQTKLCRLVGGQKQMARFYRSLNMKRTVAAPCTRRGQIWWGHTRTTANDQLLLVRTIAAKNAHLSPRARRYLASLMQHVTPSQRWGVSVGVPSRVAVALKDGWRPVPERSGWWQMNSIGWVHGRGRNYVIAVLSQSPPSSGHSAQSVGKTTDAGVSKRMWTLAAIPRS